MDRLDNSSQTSPDGMRFPFCWKTQYRKTDVRITVEQVFKSLFPLAGWGNFLEKILKDGEYGKDAVVGYGNRIVPLGIFLLLRYEWFEPQLPIPEAAMMGANISYDI